MLKEDYEILKNIYNKYSKLIEKSIEVSKGDNDWEIWSPVFDRIFSKNVSRKIYELLPYFEPYIPDTTYQADVCAFWYAFEEELNNIEVC